MKERKIIGYNPFLDYEHLNDKDNTYIINYFKNYSFDTAMAILWIMTDERMHVLLVIENAKKLYDYTIKWCDDSIDGWFFYNFTETEDGVEISIFQNIKKTIERYNKVKYCAENAVLTTPITAFTKDKTNYLKCKNENISVGIIDILDVQFGNYNNFFVFTSSKMDINK